MTRDICSQLKWWAENCDRCNGGCQVRDLLKDAAQEISALRAQQEAEKNEPPQAGGENAMRTKGYKCYNVNCGSCICKTLCGEPADTALGCASRMVNVKTNADRIRAMSDEELAEVLCGADFCGCCEYERDNGTCHYIDLHPNGKLFDGCVKAALKWLQQPAEEVRE